jgi:hypothetical protein
MLEDDFLKQMDLVFAVSRVLGLSQPDGLQAQGELEIRSFAHCLEQENWGDFHRAILEMNLQKWESM